MSCTELTCPQHGHENREARALTGHTPFASRARAQQVHGAGTGGHVHLAAPCPSARDCAADCGADCRDCVVTAVLVACTLGARRQPELRTDMYGSVARACAAVRDALLPIARLFAAPPSRTARLRAWLAR